jgi:hypothetical protein
VKAHTVCAAFIALALALPAAAEPQRLAQASMAGALPPFEILTIVRSTGLDPLSRPVRRGPNYVLRAIDDDDREVRVLVDARSGEVLSVAPVVAASRLPPHGAIVDPYDRAPPSARYIRPGARDIYRAEPPIDDDDAPPNFRQQPARYSQPPARDAAPPSDRTGSTAASEPQVITAIEPGRDGLLPPPPERFPQRVPPAAEKPQPQKRAVASIPKQAPLPRPRPAIAAKPPSESGDATSALPANKPAAPLQH